MQDRVSRREPAPVGRCPICGEPRDAGYSPFCSPRCATIDLGRWLTGGYAIPGGTDEADEDGDDVKARVASGHKPGEGKDEDV